MVGVQTLVQSVPNAEELTDAEIAAELIRCAHTDETIFAALVPVVAREMLIWRRNQTRAMERRATTDGVTDPLAGRQALMERALAVPGKGYVLWGAMTVEDHRARIRFLQSAVHGIAKTIQVHRDAIKQIEEAGVRCLNDIPDAA